MMAERLQTIPKAPTPGAALPHVCSRGQPSRAVPPGLLTDTPERSETRSNLFSFHSAVHLQHIVFGIKAQQCYTKQLNLLLFKGQVNIAANKHQQSTCTTAPSSKPKHIQTKNNHHHQQKLSLGSQNCYLDETPSSALCY